MIENDEEWETVIKFLFDEDFDGGADVSDHEFLALNAISSTLGTSMYDVSTVSIGDDGNGKLEIVFSFVADFEVTAADESNIRAAFYTRGADCLGNETNVVSVLPGIEKLLRSTTRLSAAQRRLCVVQYFSNYPRNTVTQWQDDTGFVNYYVSTTRAAWVRYLPAGTDTYIKILLCMMMVMS